jgi:hypothetical protein
MCWCRPCRSLQPRSLPTQSLRYWDGEKGASSCGPETWCLDLQIDAKGRFPNYELVIPSGSRPTRLMVSEADAQFLMDALPGLPNADEESGPVTFDLGEQALVRSRSETAATEVLLGSSRVTGPPFRVSVHRRLLARALRLGFRTMELHAADKPMVARDQQRILVIATIEPKQIVEPSPDMVRLNCN